MLSEDDAPERAPFRLRITSRAVVPESSELSIAIYAAELAAFGELEFDPISHSNDTGDCPLQRIEVLTFETTVLDEM